MSELKACPFCGGKAVLHSVPASPEELDNTMYWVECAGTEKCESCGASLFAVHTKSEAIDNWNSRPIEYKLQVELDVSKALHTLYRYLPELEDK